MTKPEQSDHRAGSQKYPDKAWTNFLHIRIRYFTLRLAKSDVFTPRFWEHQYVVDQYMNFLKEEDEIYRWVKLITLLADGLYLSNGV